MEYDNRKNAALAILSKLSRDLLKICSNFGGCLARPQRDLCTIMLIIDSDKLENEHLVKHLKEHHMTVKMECDCDSDSIEKCLPFAIFYFMEKQKWFRIGECFVQDGFLWWKQTNLPRIQIHTHCSSEGNVYIKFSAEMIRIHPFDHWILDSDERFHDFNSGPISRRIRPRWVSCLPKLGKGRIVKIHRKIPETAPFESYDQMKSYWKKTYGYDLPPSEPEVYYDVLFHNGETMLYPLYCVLTGTPEVLENRVGKTMTSEALALFLKAFKEASIVICGSVLAPEDQDCQAVKAYLDVMSMSAINSSKLKKEEKVTRKSSGGGHEEHQKPYEIRKIYPKIPVGVKRSISSSSQSGLPIVKKARPGFSVSVD